MYDPSTVAWEIKSPFRKVLCEATEYRPRQYYRSVLVTMWHVDPCKGPGGDDSCGWFKRAHHGDKKVLARIEKAIEFDWDRTFTSHSSGHTYNCGLFKPDGHPNLSVIGITLDLFFSAISAYYNADGRSNWKKSRRWMQRHLFDLMHFAENPTDSLFDSITRKFEDGCGEVQTEYVRKDRIHNMACVLYGYILRAEQTWWQHPRWHIHHWKIQVHCVGALKRFLFSRCSKCGGRFKWNESPVSNNWNSTGPLWFRSEQGIYHDRCSGYAVAQTGQAA